MTPEQRDTYEDAKRKRDTAIRDAALDLDVIAAVKAYTDFAAAIRAFSEAGRVKGERE